MRHNRQVRWVAVFFLICLFWLPDARMAWADDTLTPEQVKRHYDKGNKHLFFNSWSSAAKQFEIVIKHAPEKYVGVHFILAQIYELQKKNKKAALCYYAYMELGYDPEAKRRAQKSLRRLKGPGWLPLHVRVNSMAPGTVRVGNYILSRDGETKKLMLPPGKYNIHVELQDHEPDVYHIKLRRRGVSISSSPMKKTLYGKLELQVDKPGVSVVIRQERHDGEHEIKKPIQTKTPIQGSFSLPSGVYLVEVVSPDYQTWMRRFYLYPKSVTSFEIKLDPALPNEIRYSNVFSGKNGEEPGKKVSPKKLKNPSTSSSLRLVLPTSKPVSDESKANEPKKEDQKPEETKLAQKPE